MKTGRLSWGAMSKTGPAASTTPVPSQALALSAVRFKTSQTPCAPFALPICFRTSMLGKAAWNSEEIAIVPRQLFSGDQPCLTAVNQVVAYTHTVQIAMHSRRMITIPSSCLRYVLLAGNVNFPATQARLLRFTVQLYMSSGFHWYNILSKVH